MKSSGGDPTKGLRLPLDSKATYSSKPSEEPLEPLRNEERRATKIKNKDRLDKPFNGCRSVLENIRELEIKREHIWKGLGRKQGIKIATLNVKGRKYSGKRDKWRDLTTMIRKNNISVLAIQESHLNKEEADKLQELYPNIIVENNGQYTNKEGISFILNKDLVGNKKWKHTELIKGRLSRLQLEWEEGQGLDIINVYSPNNEKEKVEFYKTVKDKIVQCKDLDNTILLGDFNFVESELDRFPRHGDAMNVINEFDKIKKRLNLIDGWRVQHPEEKDYTYINESMSRIDRIYMNKEIYPLAYNWYISNPGKISDHQMVTVEILKKDLPYIGKGVWRLNINMIEDKKFHAIAEKIMMKYQKLITEPVENSTKSKLELWNDMKDEIREKAMERTKKKKQEVKNNENRLTNQIKKLSQKIETTQVDRETLTNIRNELKEEKQKEYRDLQRRAKANYWKMGERCTKYWFNLNKPKFSEQALLGLVQNDKLKRKTNEMVNIAVEYHENLQKRPEMNTEREKTITLLEETVQRKLNVNQQEKLSEEFKEKDAEEALRLSKNGAAPGTDGLPYEFYKSFKKPTNLEEAKRKPNVPKIMAAVFSEIETKGLPQNEEGKGEFTDGLMFLLYKKKDKTKIENYRPITLLNTDYKLYTKNIAIKLGQIAQSIIHENQAGFIPKRSLYDHTKATQMIIEYGELMEENGYIVSLDQEKAYDKIDHDYMWRIMKAFDFPDIFIKRIQELYKSPKKAIQINGVVSRQFKVQRGVHQGDPMSCLLYNIAIEPLAEMIRLSELKGIDIKGVPQRIIVSLFADDTLVYLNENDKYETLKEIIDTFCKASTARFNLEKTEFMPFGTKEFRARFIRDRKIGNTILSENLTIIKDGQAMRTLGAWVGNGISTQAQWDSILVKQKDLINTWSKMHLSMRGKELILKALVQSRAIFLATVNGIPRDIENEMIKLYKRLIWDGKKRGLMKWEQVIAPREKGGLNMPDLRSRIEAIQVMWIKKWLAPQDKKPIWAHVMNEIIHKNIQKNPHIEEKARISWITQSWHESEGKEAKISLGIRQLLKIARKYNIEMNAPKLNICVKNKLPLWHNINCKDNYLWNKKAARELRELIKVSTIGDLMNYIENETDDKKTRRTIATKLLNNLPEGVNPSNVTPMKVKQDNLELTPTRIEENNQNQDKLTFNPDVTAKGEHEEEVRIFNNQIGTKTKRNIKNPRQPAYRTQDNISEEEVNKRSIWIVSKVTKQGYENSTAIVITYDNVLNKSDIYQCEQGVQTKTKSIALATVRALQNTKNDEITIIMNNSQIITMLKTRYIEQEDNKWIDQEDKEIWKRLLQTLRNRNGITKFKLPEGEIDEMKIEELKLEIKNNKNPLRMLPDSENVKTDYSAQGARLCKLSQKTAYKLTLERNSESPMTQATTERLNKVKTKIEDDTGVRPTTKMIWQSIKKITPFRVSDFVWKMANNKIKCGKFFAKIPGWEDKQYCKCNNVCETIEHILFRCKKNNAEESWKRTENLWHKITGKEMKKPTTETLIGIGTYKEKTRGKEDKVQTVLYQILTMATAWAIWKTRNKRIFDDRVVNEMETIGDMAATIKERILNEWEIIKIEGNKINTNPKRNMMEAFQKSWCSSQALVKLTEGQDEDKNKIFLDITLEENLGITKEDEEPKRWIITAKKT
jgi:endonuclease/exonuclease/phosphatase family metal-dependent hydrolase